MPGAALTTALGAPDDGRAVGERLARLSGVLGCTALLGADEDAWPGTRLHTHRLDASDPITAEWVTVVVFPDHAMVLAARRVDGRPGSWRLALSHAADVAQAVAGQLLTRLP